MTQPLPTFRIHFSHTTDEGVKHTTRDIDAESPGAAEAALVKSFKPDPISIAKVKRVRENA